MRKPALQSLVLALTTAFAAALSAGCGSDGSGPVDPVDPVPTSVVVSPGSLALEALEATDQLSAVVLDQDGNAIASASVAWSSDASAVAMVDGSGRVTAVSVGSASVTATSGSLSGTAEVTVTQVPAAVAVTPAAVELRAEEEAPLEAAVADANGHPIPDATVAWSSSDETVATVDAQSGVVTAVAEGDTEVTASSDDASGSASVTVLAPPEDFEPTEDGTIGGTVDFGTVTIPAGVTITVTEDLVLRASGPVTIEGSLVGDCRVVSVEAEGPLTLQGATVENSCSTPTFDAPPLTLFTEVELVVEESMVRSAGDLLVTNDPDADFDDGDEGAASGSPARQDEFVDSCRVSDTTLEAGDGADGDSPGENGARGGSSWLVCIAEGVYRDITLIGGNGGEGADDNRVDDGPARGGRGSFGGDTRITARPTKLRGSIRSFPGNGGNGGDARHTPSIPGASADAVAGFGGSGGAPIIGSSFAPTEIDPLADVFIRWARGGNGGFGLAVGADGAPGQPGGAAHVVGGNGCGMFFNGPFFGSVGSLVRNVPEADRGVVRVTSLEAGHGGGARGISGRGGDGESPGDPGAPGGDSNVNSGFGGSLFLEDNGPEPTEQIPGDGGDAVFLRGLGGNGQPDVCSPGGDGGRGGNTLGIGGGRPGKTLDDDAFGEWGTTTIEGFGNGGNGADGTGGGARGEPGSNGVMLMEGAPPPVITGSFMPGLPGQDIPCATILGTDIVVTSDENDHEIHLGITEILEILVRIIESGMAIDPAGVLPELSGTLEEADDGTFHFSLHGLGTIVGIPDVVVTFEGTIEIDESGRPTALSGELVVDANNDRLPPNTDGEHHPAVYSVSGEAIGMDPSPPPAAGASREVPGGG